jgi:hypothetical protein
LFQVDNRQPKTHTLFVNFELLANLEPPYRLEVHLFFLQQRSDVKDWNKKLWLNDQRLFVAIDGQLNLLFGQFFLRFDHPFCLWPGISRF